MNVPARNVIYIFVSLSARWNNAFGFEDVSLRHKEDYIHRRFNSGRESLQKMVCRVI